MPIGRPAPDFLNDMNAPTTADLRDTSKVDFEALGFSGDAELDRVMALADGYVIAVTGRQWATMPPYLELVAQQAAVMRAEQVMYRAQEDYQEAANDDVISAFSAGPYSETRTDQSKKKLTLNSNPALAELLWLLLMTTLAYPDPAVDAMYDMWIQLLGGQHAPAFEVTEIDWSGSGMVDWYSNWHRAL